MRRITASLLAAVFVFTAAAAVSCSKPAEENAPANADTIAVTAEETTEDEYLKYDPAFASADYNGYTFHILINGNDLEPNVDFDAEELNGEVLNDAIFNRDRDIEEKYNITLDVQYQTDDAQQNNVKKSNAAGTGDYDMTEVNQNYSMQMAANGLITPIDEIPAIDLTKPYWNQITLEGSSVAGKNYFAYSDLNIHAFGATPCVIFNKQVLADYNLGDIYALVSGGTWTTDNTCGMISKVTHDLDGDGTLTKDDYWGLICNNFAVDCLVSGTGYMLIEKDENDLPYLNFPTEKFYQVVEGVRSVLSADNGAFLVDRTSTATEAREYWTEWAITENRALFWIGNLKCVERLRGMETDFGVVPMPKLDENQENYAVHRQANIGATISVPLVLNDPELVGIVLEELAYRSFKDVMPVYMNSVLEGKYFRDPESIITLRIMRESTYCDLGFMTQNFGIQPLTLCREIVTKEKDAVSSVEKLIKSYDKSLTKFVSSFGG